MPAMLYTFTYITYKSALRTVRDVEEFAGASHNSIMLELLVIY
jgi:hypothetical protein